LGTQNYFAAHVDGGMGALLASIDQPALRAFIEQPFLASAWYDVLPVAPLVVAEARATRQSTEAYLRERTRFQAKQDLGGVYKFILWLASPEAVAQRLPRMLTKLFDFGEMSVAVVEPRHVRATVTGYPALLSDWYVNTFDVYAEAALKAAGAGLVGVTASSPRVTDRRHAVDLVTFVLDVRWGK
jgi:hypothetical protein